MCCSQVCTEADVSVKPRTASGGDYMFKAAVEGALKASFEGEDAQLWGVPAARFVSNMAAALGKPDAVCELGACFVVRATAELPACTLICTLAPRLMAWLCCIPGVQLLHMPVEVRFCVLCL